jgi:hypothetical protein
MIWFLLITLIACGLLLASTLHYKQRFEQENSRADKYEALYFKAVRPDHHNCRCNIIRLNP